jgi:hypothetical protein
LDVASLARIEAAASTTVQSLFYAAGLVAKAVRHPVADPVTPIETVDLPLDVAEPHLKFANLAKTLAITPPRTLPPRIILGRCGARCGKSRTCCNE